MRSFGGDTAFFKGSSILVTGGTGSFGSAFVSKVLDSGSPQRLIIYSRDELKQYEMQQRFAGHKNASLLRFFIGDVRDLRRLSRACRSVDYIVHAAALKHVPAAEYNPTECIHTNIIGAENVVHAAIESGVKKVIALSTDKACNPVNLYGATKLASDKVFVAANSLAGKDGCRFSIVRYGNVLGSRGSVVPLFKKMIAQGEKRLPVTDPDMTRFWLTIGQGVDFVIRSFYEMDGGEIFVPKIPSMKMSDLVHTIAPHAKIKKIGIRPGEKMHEIMISSDDSRDTYDFGDYYAILPAFKYWEEQEHPIENATKVPSGFQYSSDQNEEWLDSDGFLKILGNTNVSSKA